MLCIFIFKSSSWHLKVQDKMVDSGPSNLLLPLNTLLSVPSSFPIWWQAQAQMLTTLRWDRCVYSCRMSLPVLKTCLMDISCQQYLFLLPFKWEVEPHNERQCSAVASSSGPTVGLGYEFQSELCFSGSHFLTQWYLPLGVWGGFAEWVQEKQLECASCVARCGVWHGPCAP